MSDKVEIVKVRKIGMSGEHVIHVPKGIDGYFFIKYDPTTGVLKYVPVKEGDE